MDAVGFFFGLLANFFPLLGSVILIAVIIAVGLFVAVFLMSIVVALICVLLD